MTRGSLAVVAAWAAIAGPARGDAVLSATVYVAPSYVTVGQAVSMFVDVMNVGNDTALQVAASDVLQAGCPAAGVVTLSDPTYVTLVSGPSPSCTATLDPGQHAIFTWGYAASASGFEAFTVSVTGRQLSPPLVLAAADSDGVTIALPAKLVTTIATSPVLTGTYQSPLTVTLFVTNTGQVPADGVTPLSLTLTGSLGLVYQGCPPLWPYGQGCLNPAKDIAPGETVAFAWQYLDGQPGVDLIKGAAAGRDHNSGQPILSTTSTVAYTVPFPAILNLVTTGPAELVQGQTFRLKIRAVNFGATPVCQSALTVAIGGSQAPIESVTPELHDLNDSLPVICYAPGQTREFTLVVRLRGDAPLGPNVVTVVPTAHETYSLTPAYATGAGVPVTIFAGLAGITTIAPNPFRLSQAAETRVTFVVTAAQDGLPLAVRVFSLTGELVRTLVDEPRAAGVYEVAWNGRNRTGQPVASGIVLVLYEGLGRSDVRKLAVIK